jgi:hypothetical protein
MERAKFDDFRTDGQNLVLEEGNGYGEGSVGTNFQITGNFYRAK